MKKKQGLREDQGIQTATPADLDALVHLEKSSFPAGDVFSRRQYRGLLANPRATIRIVRDGDRLGASAVLLRRQTRAGVSARLYSMCVSPESRGQGLGGKLLADLIDLCRREGIGRLHLEVRHNNEAAISLYRKFGFAIDHHLEHYYGSGQHGVKMVLEV